MSKDEDLNDEKELSQTAKSEPVGSSILTATPEQKKASQWIYILVE